MAIEDTDAIINNFYENLYSEKGEEKPLLEDMSTEEHTAFAKKEAELNKEPESQHLELIVDQQTNALAATNGSHIREDVSMMNGETAAAR